MRALLARLLAWYRTDRQRAARSKARREIIDDMAAAFMAEVGRWEASGYSRTFMPPTYHEAVDL